MGNVMRLLFGIVVGFLLAIGVAYFNDAKVQTATAQIVNWEVPGTVAHEQTVAIRRLWNETLGQIGKNEAG